MKEIKKILDKYSKIDFSSRKAAIATVVKVEGSSYRRPGARMLMTDDGRWEGAISGGCLEGDALRKSRQVILENRPMLVLYDTNDDGSGNLGVGLGCNGIIEILIEPVDEASSSNPVTFLNYLLHQKEASIIATIFYKEGSVDAKVGERLIYQNGEVIGSISNSDLNDFLLEEAKATSLGGKSVTKTFHLSDGVIRVFIEVVQPNIQLLIFGGGYDAIPLTKQAKEMGWDITVTDECIAHLVPSRFPDADSIIASQRTTFLDSIDITKRTAAVLMTHSYKYDKALLKQLMSTPVGYIGMLGPKKRFEKMLNEWEAEGLETRQFPDKVNSPAGLDIGAETPEEIALSIISEIQAHFAGRAGASLKEKEGPIHQREQETVSILPVLNNFQ